MQGLQIFFAIYQETQRFRELSLREINATHIEASYVLIEILQNVIFFVF